MIFIVLAAVFVGLGIYIFVCPKQATKKENREDEAAVAKTKKAGILYIVIGVVMILVGVASWEKEVQCSSCNNKVKVVWYSDSEKYFCDECMAFLKNIFG